MATSIPQSGTFTAYASRWTRGNFIFPVQIIVTNEHVMRVKRRFFGTSEESIAIGKVASVHIEAGLIWADITIESSGGTDPIVSHGHAKSDAERIRELVEHWQSQQAGAKPQD
jgi:hypothetical protein